MMKRVLPLMLAAAIGAGMLSACSGGAVTTGLGIETDAASSKSATADAAGNVQINSTIAVISLDKNGKITKCSIDVAQTNVPFDAAGVVTADKSAEIQSKVEKGDAYNMKGATSIGKEWYEQSAAFEKWCIGKTVQQVEDLKTKVKDDHHDAVPDVAELASTVTINVGEFKEAVLKAAQNAREAKNAGSGYKTGLGIETGIGSSADAAEDKAGKGQVDSYIAAVTLDSKGKIVSCTLDSAQTAVSFDAAGQVTTDLNAAILSKLEKKDQYGMRGASGIGKEWFEQADAFSQWCIGKTLAEVKGLKTKKVNDAHLHVPDVPELASTVTIDAGEFVLAVEKAVNNAK